MIAAAGGFGTLQVIAVVLGLAGISGGTLAAGRASYVTRAMNAQSATIEAQDSRISELERRDVECRADVAGLKEANRVLTDLVSGSTRLDAMEKQIRTNHTQVMRQLKEKVS